MSANTMTVRHRYGYIGVFGDEIDTYAKEASEQEHVDMPHTAPYHMTLIAKFEIQQLVLENRISLEGLVEEAQQLESRSIYPLGVGGDPKGVCWVVMVWNAGNIFRKKLGLPCKQFHITLSKVDDHNVDKGVRSLRDEGFTARLDSSQMDHLVVSCNLGGESSLASCYAREMCARFPEVGKGWIRLGDCARQEGASKLAMLAYARSLQCPQESARLGDYCAKKLLQCSLETGWGCLFGDNEYEQIPDELRSHLLSPWPRSLRETAMRIYESNAPLLVSTPRIHLQVPLVNVGRAKAEAGTGSLLLLVTPLTAWQSSSLSPASSAGSSLTS
uniref:Swiss Army Knife 2H phosphoesterase domain-containing protein n=1 Tax=Guillardia theta TaxID=55529 RepID=A0A7S4NBN1_GUITH|mmetsp:Transcript_19440/g.64399  ORF Transcript_19440/g.64399 Transcript_19440/m.64399 type:complete len:330 (+) Transcript_19440:177-1166(+)